MDNKSYTFRGRRWSKKEIELIKDIIKEKKYRTAISKKVCEIINWRQTNGRLKDAACREVLRRMDKQGLINLPLANPYSLKFKTPGSRGIRPRDKWKNSFRLNQELVETDLEEIHLEIANNGVSRNLWEYLIDKYHYLGYRRPVGACIKYLIHSNERVVACIGFASAVLKLNLRDKWIGWTVEQRQRNLHLVINNVRFLILPWVRVKNLASRILSTASKEVQKDWESFYGYRPVLIETFVDIGKFRGTSYKASNWICLGRTKGEGRCGMKYFIHNRPKDIYVYPLCKDYLRILRCH
jgi:hypothetical protein